MRLRFVLLSVVMATLVMVSIGNLLIAAENEQVIEITAKKFEYNPKEISVKKGGTGSPAIHVAGQVAWIQLPGLEDPHGYCSRKSKYITFCP
jgi:hypothetical protein